LAWQMPAGITLLSPLRQLDMPVALGYLTSQWLHPRRVLIGTQRGSRLCDHALVWPCPSSQSIGAFAPDERNAG